MKFAGCVGGPGVGVAGARVAVGVTVVAAVAVGGVVAAADADVGVLDAAVVC